MSEITPNTPNPVREDAYKQQLAAKLGIDPQYIPGSPIWHSEEEIAAIDEMFSNMSGGSSGGGVLVVHDADGTLDKTWQEIADAGFAVCYVQPSIPVLPTMVYVLCSIKDDEDEPFVQFYSVSGMEESGKRQYDATSKNDYPVYVD